MKLRQLILLAFIPLLLTACASNPTGGANFVLMSEKAEIEKGKEMHEEILQQTPVYDDPELQAYVDQIGQRVAASSHRPELEYHFTIIDSPDINAFALPGGYIYINRGLMTYLTSESQLAAVLGHEIGHVTGRHSVRQQTASRTANILTGALVIATGVREIQETTSLVGGALLSGYGRDMELEADSLGAEYLFNAGYDPMAMVDVITVLKNHEDFTKRTSNRGVSYHGLFASHPRNDRRLQEVVGKAGSLSSQQQTTLDPAEFRNQLSGLLVGPSQQIAGNSEARNRYYQNLLNFTMVFPDNWSIEETTITVTGYDEANQSSLKVDVQRLQESIEPRLYIRENLNIPGLQRSEALSQFGLVGYTGINPDTNERVAVIYYGPRAFIFTGKADNTDAADAMLMATIQSFRPIARNELAYANPSTLEYIQSDGSSYAELASNSPLLDYPEDMLRLYNGDYPSGEPEAGEWIKIVD
jgi:predicted Zn-dependent protease